MNMYNIDESSVRSILKKNFSSLVGKSCKRIEVIRDTPNIDFATKLNLIRDLIRELDYETMRDIEVNISSFSDGTKIQVSLTKPER